MVQTEAASAPDEQLLELVRANERPLTQFTARICGAERARDIVQESFLRLYRERPPGSAAELRSWLYTVCRNLAFDLLRKERRVRTLDSDSPEPAASPPASELLEAQETQSRALSLLATLPPRQQEVLRLKFQGSLSYKEIAELTQLTVGNVGYLIHVGLKTLRRALSDGAQEGGAS